MRAIAILPAAGLGSRFGGDVPKQYTSLHDQPLYAHTLARCEAAETVSGIIVVVAAERVLALRETLPKQFPKVMAVVAGGHTRQASVINGFRAIDGECDIVAVHDMARPLVTPGLIDRCIEVAAQCGAAILATPADDTVKQVTTGDVIDATLPREMIWLAQTPQAARYELFQRAVTHAESTGLVGTDEAALIEALGEPVRIVAGPRWNMKITTPEDMIVAHALLQAGAV